LFERLGAARVRINRYFPAVFVVLGVAVVVTWLVIRRPARPTRIVDAYSRLQEAQNKCRSVRNRRDILSTRLAVAQTDAALKYLDNRRTVEGLYLGGAFFFLESLRVRIILELWWLEKGFEAREIEFRGPSGTCRVAALGRPETVEMLRGRYNDTLMRAKEFWIDPGAEAAVKEGKYLDTLVLPMELITEGCTVRIRDAEGNWSNAVVVRVTSWLRSMLATIDEPAEGSEAAAVTPGKDLPTKQVDVGGGVEMELVRIPAGEFMMGSPELEGFADENPQHRVRITKPFDMSEKEDTAGQDKPFRNGGGEPVGVAMGEADYCPLTLEDGEYVLSGNPFGQSLEPPMVMLTCVLHPVF
jgi:hypothetical protein